MRILLLNPPFFPEKGRFSRASRSPAIARGGTLYYPVWLAYACGVLEKAGHSVRLLDAPAMGLDMAGVFLTLGEFTPQLVVVETSTPSIYEDVRSAVALKKHFPGCFLLLTGTHPSALPRETLELSPLLDGVALGEYDYTLRDLAAALEQGNAVAAVPGLVVRRDDGSILRTRERDKISDLDQLPFISAVCRRHLDPGQYFFAAAPSPMMMIITGRGCPFHCFFCVYPQTFHGHRYRTRSPENVVDEFVYIRDNLPQVREILIEDDCFTANPARVRAICVLLLERHVHLSWTCNARGDVDYETLCLMKRAGCRMVITGFESGNQQVLDAMGKQESVAGYLRFARDVRRAGLLLHGCMMCGTPGDTPAVQAENFRFAARLNCDSLQFYPLFVYPGTEAYRWAREKGYLLTEDFSRWLDEEGGHRCVISTDAFTAEEMMETCRSATSRWHLRPGYLLRKLWQGLRDPAEGLRSLRAGMNLVRSIIRHAWSPTPKGQKN